MTKFIFVYGTLKQGEHNNSLLQGCHYVGDGIAIGCALIDMGGCPGMVLAQCHPNDFAKGEIYEVANIDHLLAQLDRVENEGRVYRRVLMEIETPTRIFDCWTYLYMPHFAHDQFVKGGKWSLSPANYERIYGGAS